jgi:GNAT superfamily N-acetyltransferase
MTPKVSHQIPTANEYNELRRLAEWPTFDEELVNQALSNSLFSVVVHDENGVIIGMNRILGDNAIYLHVQDVIVKPEYQRNGIGKLIMDELLAYIENTGVKNTNVGLMCSKGREAFYKDFGFQERPNEKFGAEMIRLL